VGWKFRGGIDESIPLRKIAKTRGVGNAAIRKHIREGRLPAERIGQRTFYVREHDLANFNPRPYRKRK
jgi:hypothetical protein